MLRLYVKDRLAAALYPVCSPALFMPSKQHSISHSGHTKKSILLPLNL